MKKLSVEEIRATAENQRRTRNLAAMHTVAKASGKTETLTTSACCGAALTPEERLLHAIFGTCPPEESR